MKKPEKKYTEYKAVDTCFTSANHRGYNQACDDWEAYHNQEMNKLTPRGCGGGWTYDEMRNCFTNQMGDVR